MSTTYPYLGTVGAMQQLPGPNGDITANPSRSETVHALLSGGRAKWQRLYSKSEFNLPYQNRPGIGLDDLLMSFYDGVFDVAGLDLVYVHPPRVNVLTLDQSQMGLRPGASLGWATSSGTIAKDTGTAGPTGVVSAVAKWSSPPASGWVQPGLAASVASPAVAPVVLVPEAVTVSLYVKASAAATLTFGAAGHTASGSDNSSFTSSTISVTTSWQRFTVTANAGAFGTSALVVPRLKMPASSPPSNVWIAGGQLEYGPIVSPFTRGYGSPRVMIVSTPGDTRQKWDGYSQHTLVLGEV